MTNWGFTFMVGYVEDYFLARCSDLLEYRMVACHPQSDNITPGSYTLRIKQMRYNVLIRDL